MMLENHYAKKWNQAFGLVNVGVFDSDKLLGIASFGHSMNPKSWPSITKSDPDKCLELNRLWIDDSLKKNTETWLLSKSWSILREKGYELVQSFSDGRLGVGTIYQAANFSYHGFHETLFHQTSDGVIYHDVQFSNTNRPTGMIKRNLFYARGEVVKTFTVNTYRYLYPLSKSARKKILIPSLPYPKVREGERIIENYSPPPLQVARALLIAKTFFRLDEVETLKNYLDFISDNCSDKYIELAKENIVIQKISDKYADALF
jgi:integrase